MHKVALPTQHRHPKVLLLQCVQELVSSFLSCTKTPRDYTSATIMVCRELSSDLDIAFLRAVPVVPNRLAVFATKSLETYHPEAWQPVPQFTLPGLLVNCIHETFAPEDASVEATHALSFRPSSIFLLRDEGDDDLPIVREGNGFDFTLAGAVSEHPADSHEAFPGVLETSLSVQLIAGCYRQQPHTHSQGRTPATLVSVSTRWCDYLHVAFSYLRASRGSIFVPWESVVFA